MKMKNLLAVLAAGAVAVTSLSLTAFATDATNTSVDAVLANSKKALDSVATDVVDNQGEAIKVKAGDTIEVTIEETSITANDTTLNLDSGNVYKAQLSAGTSLVLKGKSATVTAVSVAGTEKAAGLTEALDETEGYTVKDSSNADITLSENDEVSVTIAATEVTVSGVTVTKNNDSSTAAKYVFTVDSSVTEATALKLSGASATVTSIKVTPATTTGGGDEGDDNDDPTQSDSSSSESQTPAEEPEQSEDDSDDGDHVTNFGPAATEATTAAAEATTAPAADVAPTVTEAVTAANGESVEAPADVIPDGAALEVKEQAKEEAVKAVEAVKATDENKEVVAAVKKAVEDSKAAVVDIDLVKAGEKVQPNGTIKVTINVPTALKEAAKLFVYRVEADGKFTDVKATVENGKIVFTTSHFSTYIVTSEALSGTAVVEETTAAETTAAPAETTTAAPEKTDDKNQATGVVLAIVPAIIAAAGVVISKKRK